MSWFGEGQDGLMSIVEGVSKEKHLDPTVVIKVMEQTVLQAARCSMLEADLEANFNFESGQIELFQFRKVVPDEGECHEQLEIRLKEAKQLDPNTEIGDALGVKLDTSVFGRIAVQSAKHTLVQKVKEAERQQVYEEYKERAGTLMTGYIQRADRQDILINFGKVDGILPAYEQVRGERYRVKDRIQVYVLEVRQAMKGPLLLVSRAHPGFLMKLFEQNVTEIADGIVSVLAAARDPGLRSKIAVHSKDVHVDPVGACVGVKGTRVQAVIQELGGEKIDIIPWDQDPARFVCHALAPAVVNKVVIDDERKAMEVIVAEDQLSLAIGKHGQNVKLAAQLTHWRLEIKSEAKLEEQLAGVKAVLATIAGLGDMHAGILVHEGIRSPEELGAMAPRVLARLLNLEVTEAEKVLEAAREKAEELSRKGIVDTEDYRAEDAGAAPRLVSSHEEEQARRRQKMEVFLKLKGIGEATAYALAEGGYETIGDVIADSPEEVGTKTGIPLGIAKTVQRAADRYLQEHSSVEEEG
jgi:N utilization substance protein A